MQEEERKRKKKEKRKKKKPPHSQPRLRDHQHDIDVLLKLLQCLPCPANLHT